MFAPAAPIKSSIPLLVGGTLLLQLSILAAGVFIKLSLPDRQVAPARTAEAAAPAPLSESADEALLPEDSAGGEGAADAPKVVTYRIKPGDTLSRIWEIHGAPANGAVLAAKAFKSAGVPLKALRPGEELELQISAGGDISAVRKQLPAGKQLLLEGDSLKGYRAEVISLSLEEKERVVSGVVTKSFSEAAVRAGLPPGMVDELVDLFSSRIEFRRDLHPGDAFAVVYDERLGPDGARISTGPIKAASLEKGGRRLFALRHTGSSGKSGYFDQLGKPLGDSFLRYPLKFSRISSAFSYGRFHPVFQKTLPHNGIDFAAPAGTPVRSVGGGVVTFAGYNWRGGNTVKIRHGERYTTAYLHLSRLGPGVRTGSRVERGQVIGAVGSTGISTGPHLHFSFFDRGRYVNPLKIELPSNDFGAEPIPPSILQARIDQLTESQELVRMAYLRQSERRS